MEAYDAILTRLKQIHDSKAVDYSKEDNRFSNFEFASQVIRNFTDPVDLPYVTLIAVKLARLSVLLENRNAPNNESVQDTFYDLCNYCILWTEYRESLTRALSGSYLDSGSNSKSDKRKK